MATFTKNTRNLIGTRASLATIGASSSSNGTQDLSTALGATVIVRVVSGSSFTAAADVRVETGNGTQWETFALWSTGTTVSTNYDFSRRLPPDVGDVKVTITNNDGTNSITGYAIVEETSSIS